MPELVNIQYPKRVKFSKGKQGDFLELVMSKLNISVDETARLVNVHGRTLRDWKREKFLMPLQAVLTLSRQAKIPQPRNIEIKKPFWHTVHAGSIGGSMVLNKYGCIGGDPEYRKQKWHEWWEREGRFEKHPIINVRKPISKPRHSKELAEFMGIMMGDGGLSKNQAYVTLHHKDDLEYSKFVAGLIKKLFKIIPSVYHKPQNSVNVIVVSRIELVQYLNLMGLPIGNKIRQNLDIPNWIKNNSSYSIACLRGLIDTDGCIFTHSYKVGKKIYSYKKMTFTTASLALRDSVNKLLINFGLSPRVTKDGKELRLDREEDIIKYFQFIGSNNQKHLRRKII